MCYRVIRDAKRRIGNNAPRAEDDDCPAYYGVDYKEERGKSVCKFTYHEGTKTSDRKGNERLERKNRIAGGAAAASETRRRRSKPVSREALRSLENAFSEFMPERFYGISNVYCAKGKIQAVATIPGSGKHDRLRHLRLKVAAPARRRRGPDIF
ncbi:hypothetical protein JL722_12838 [Aureococcus anophagefferens]|nr:hypothetical protein JL722_12838 [Aureococcus anophagefferens]